MNLKVSQGLVNVTYLCLKNGNITREHKTRPCLIFQITYSQNGVTQDQSFILYKRHSVKERLKMVV